MREEYKPFACLDGFYIETKGEEKYFCGKVNGKTLRLELNQKTGYVPKSGLLFTQVLKDNLKGKSVLDLGCGYLGTTGMIANCYDPERVVCTDIDPDAVSWLSKLIEENSYTNMQAIKSNYFCNVPQQEFDIILSNPPQMPMKFGSAHDSGGYYGTKDIKKILGDARLYLKFHGVLYMLLFDFLLSEPANKEASIPAFSGYCGYEIAEVIFSEKKYIKPGSVTYQSMPYIQQVYPMYKFKQDGNGWYCNILIVRFSESGGLLRREDFVWRV